MRLSEMARITSSKDDRVENGVESSMKIGQMFFGSTDANNEYLQTGDDLFLQLFCENPRFDVNKVLDGSVSFICGDKGTGKTMFLRYVELMAKRDACPTEFVRYKRQVSESDKRMLGRASANAGEEVVDDAPHSFAASTDYVLGWQLYLIKVIVSLVRKSECESFERGSDEWARMVDLIDDVYGAPGSRMVNRLIPKLSKGQVTVNTKHVKLALGFEPGTQGEECKIPFGELAQGVVELYSVLPCNSEAVPAYVFIDEIELTYGQRKEYVRNITLVRDLILAVAYLNDIARENGFPVHIVMALRNEVYRSAKSVGYELNKPIEDFGVQIDWRLPSGDASESPLVRIVEKRVSHNVPAFADNPDFIWSYFFPSVIDGIPVKNYVLNQTWSKPRDIVRLLVTLQEHCGDGDKFCEGDFFAIRRDYSKKAWNEMEEELRANYSEVFVDGVKKILSGITCPFTMEGLRAKAERESRLFECVRSILDEKTLPELIEVLFKFGVIGNVRGQHGAGRARFMAYGDDEPDMHGEFTIHFPLRSVFDVRAD